MFSTYDSWKCTPPEEALAEEMEEADLVRCARCRNWVEAHDVDSNGDCENCVELLASRPHGSDPEKEAPECNADAGHPCDANDGEPCAARAKWLAEQAAYFRAMWNAASPEERDPAKYQRDMIDAGRDHLLPVSGPTISSPPKAKE